MEFDKELTLSSLSPLTLAFLGDTVFDLLVRSDLVASGNRPVKDLHRTATTKVCASAQAAAITKIMSMLTEEETEVFKRGRNAHTGSIPKNQSPADYHYATGLECLFGWLYLSKKDERIKELYNALSEEEK